MKIFPLIFWFCILLSASAADTPVPLAGAATRNLDDEASDDGKGGWTDDGPENSLNAFPTGRTEFEGIPFEIPSDAPAVVVLQGKAWPDAPESVEIPLDGMKGRAIYFLSAHAWTDGPIELARLVVRYANGREDSFPIINLTHTGPWWNPISRPQAPVAWRGENRHGIPIGVYLSGFPLQNEPLASLTIKGSRISGQFLLLGLTVSDKPVSSLPNRPQWVRVDEPRQNWFPLAAPQDSSSLPAWDSIRSQSPAVADRELLMELAPPLSTAPADQTVEVPRLLKSLGYTGARLSPLDPLLAPPDSAAHKEGITRLTAALTEAGIKTSLTLAGGRSYSEADGVAAFRDLDPRLGEIFFVDPAATTILHRDLKECREYFPTSGLAPSQVLFDSGLFSYHLDGMTRPHRRMLLNRWAAWLRERHKNQDLQQAWQVDGQVSPLLPSDNLARSKVELLSLSNILAASPRFRKRIADQITFLDKIQREWFLAQKDFADKNLPPAAWSTTAWIAPTWLRDLQTGLAASLDVVEDRTELMRPDLSEEDGKFSFLDISPLSEVGIADFLTPYYRVAGKPFIVWDVTGVWPGERDFLRVLRTMVVAARQGWAGVLHRTLDSTAPSDSLLENRAYPGPALQNPSFLAVLPLGRNLFLRKDLDAAAPMLRRPLLLPADIESKLPAVPSRSNPLGDEFPGWLPFVGGVEAGPGLAEWRDADAIGKCRTDGVISSPDGQITLHPGRDLLEIRTPRSAALAGTLDQITLDSVGVSISGASGFGCAYATSLDGLPLDKSQAILLGLVGRCENTGTTYERSSEPRGPHDSVWRISDPGTPPILMEPVSAKFSFASASPGKWTLTALDAFGRPIGQPPQSIQVTDSEGLKIPLDNKTFRAPIFLLRHED